MLLPYYDGNEVEQEIIKYSKIITSLIRKKIKFGLKLKVKYFLEVIIFRTRIVFLFKFVFLLIETYYSL